MSESESVTVVLNGEARSVRAGATIAELVSSLGLKGPVAVERNRELVPRARHGETVLAEGDELEVVHFVGGG